MLHIFISKNCTLKYVKLSFKKKSNSSERKTVFQGIHVNNVTMTKSINLNKA